MSDYEIPVPHDPESERVLLNTMVLSPDHPQVPAVLSLLNGGEAFVVPAHRAIYLSLKSLLDRREEISLVGIHSECMAQGSSHTVGGYVGLCESLGSDEVSQPLGAAQRVHASYLRRKLQRLAQGILTRAGDLSQDPRALLAEIRDLDTSAEPLLTFTGINDLLDTPAEPPTWVIQGLIPKAVPCVVASKGGLGKSFLFLQACVALAAGKAFLDYPAQTPMAVLYLNLEDPREAFKARLQSIVRWYQESGDWTPQDDANLRQHLEAPVMHWRAAHSSSHLPVLVPFLESWILRHEHLVPGMVVIDTLARVSEGDENTVQALRPVLNACLRLCEMGYSSVLLHHTGKGQDGAKAKAKERPRLADRMSTEWVRGSSSIVDNFRAVIQMTSISEEEADGAGLDQDKARRGGYCVMGATKANGPHGDWKFLEQDEHGRWFLNPKSLDILASLRGRKAVAELDKQTLILRDLFEATRWTHNPDMGPIIECHFAGSKDPKAAFRQVIFRLRNAGLVQKTGYGLTISGVERIKVTLEGVGDD